MLSKMLGNNTSFLPATRAFPIHMFRVRLGLLYPLCLTRVSRLKQIRETSIDGLSEKLNDYTLLKVLGEGGFGTVWLAETIVDDGERTLVAIKVIRRSNLRGPATCVHDELVFMRLFTNIDSGTGSFPHLIESFCDEHNYYIVQEYIPGGTLRDEMERNGGKLSYSRAKFILTQLITIVMEVHRQGVMHCDIKPENILVDATGNVVLIDFGLSSRFCTVIETAGGLFEMGDLRFTQQQRGTLGYMAPEILRGEEYSYPVDMYSLGVVFYEMVAGIPPFLRVNHQDMLMEMMNYQFEIPLDHLQKEVAQLIYMMMRRFPEDRISFPAISRHRFFDKLDWHLVRFRLYDLSARWAPPVARVDRSEPVSKSVLVDHDRIRMPYGPYRLTPLDRAFVTPRRTPTVKRPIPELAVFDAPQVSKVSRDTTQPSMVDPRSLVPQSTRLCPEVQDEAHLEHRASNEERLFVEGGEVEEIVGQAGLAGDDIEEGEIVEERGIDGVNVIVGPVREAMQPSVLGIPKPSPGNPDDPVTRQRNGGPAFAFPITQVDQLLLSPPPGLGPRRALVYQARTSSRASSNSEVHDGQALLAPPRAPALDATTKTLPPTPGPVTPVSAGMQGAIRQVELKCN